MKFAKYIDDNAIAEWKRAYFDYKKGKKLIKRVVDTLPGSVKRARTWSQTFSTPITPLKLRRTGTYEGQSYGAVENDQNGDRNRKTSPTASNFTDEEISHISSTAVGGPEISKPSSAVTPDTIHRKQVPLPHEEICGTLGEGRLIAESDDSPLVPGKEVEQTFFNFVHEEIGKVDKFYTDRENEAGKRLGQLRVQLEEMKDRRKHMGSRRIVTKAERRANARADYTRPVTWVAANMRSLLEYADIDLLDRHPIDDDPQMESNAQLQLSYRVARRRLKIASQEFYQSLEMLRSYRTLNRTALVKVMKKYDKTLHAKAGPAVLKSYDEETYIGTSDFLEKIMHKAEEFYAKYYYHGDRKHAVAALRIKEHTEDYRFTMLRVGFYFGLSIPLMLEGLVKSQQQDTMNELRIFLLQVWGAFFLLILISLLFGVNCYVIHLRVLRKILIAQIWAKNKINYCFIFEYDIRHNLTWMQYLELPGLIMLLFSITFWLCFSDFFPSFETWYPLLFVGLCAIFLFIPVPYLHLSTRKWLLIDHGRLLVSGISSVRFQDVFLGDLYNSLTYSAGNLALFFCLYRYNWHDPAQCGSGHSILLGFFSATPGIVRLLQCFRRFSDTRHYFPHIVNAGKYTVTILQYTCLSLWRIHKADRFKALYIIFATINTIYSSVWDIVMDVSLLQPRSAQRLLRDDRAFSWTWVCM